MAENQPVQPPAPTGQPQANPPEPATPPAEGTPAAQSISFDTFSDEDKKYLAGQGITKQEELTQDALVKVFNHARSSQQTAQQRQAEIDRIKASVNPTPPPTDPFAPPVQPNATDPTQTPAPQQQQAQQQVQGIDPATAFVLTDTFARQFPELKDNLLDGSFYKDMNALGIPTVVNGQVNIQGIQGYGKMAQTAAINAAKLEELSNPKPGEGAIPDANPTTPSNPQPAADAPMTRQIALAIISQDKTHPRYAEAVEFAKIK